MSLGSLRYVGSIGSRGALSGIVGRFVQQFFRFRNGMLGFVPCDVIIHGALGKVTYDMADQKSPDHDHQGSRQYGPRRIAGQDT